MNNTVYKNSQYKKVDIDGLPYSDVHSIAYAEDTTINAIRLNNTFKQLVDNDKTVEKDLMQLSLKSAGPKSLNLDRISDKTKLHNAENGYKFLQLGASNDLSICHKIDCDLQNSIVKTSLDYGDTYSFCQVAGTTFAATSHGIYTINDDGIATLFTEYVGIADSIQADQIICKDIFYDGYRTLFATNVGIYELNSTMAKEETDAGTKLVAKLFLCKRNKTYLSDCKAIYVRPDNNMLLVSAKNGIYAGTYNPSTTLANIDLVEVNFTGHCTSKSAAANSFMLLQPNKKVVSQSNDMLALTDHGIYESKVLKESVTEKASALKGHSTSFSLEFEEKQYVGTDNGIFDAETEDCILQYPAYSYAIVSQQLYVGSVGQVVKAKTLKPNNSSPLDIDVIQFPVNENIVKLQSIGMRLDEHVGMHQLILCITDAGKAFTIDAATSTVAWCKSFPIGNGSASNGKLVLANGSAELSVISISNASGDTKSDTLSRSLSCAKAYEDLVDVTYGQMPIAAQKTKLANLSTGKTYNATDVSKIQKLNSPIRQYEYAFIDDGNLMLLNSRMAVIKSQLQAYDVADTTHLLVGIDSNGVFALDKDAFPYNSKHYIGTQPSSDCSIAANGRFAYVLNGKELSVLSEAYLLNNDDTLSNAVKASQPSRIDSYAVDDVSVALDASFVAYNGMLSVCVLSSQIDSDGYADVDDGIVISKSFPIQLNDAAFEGTSIKVATPTGLSALHLSIDLSSSQSPISIIGWQCEISGTSINAYHKVAVPNAYTFIASNNDISAYHDEYKPFSSFNARHGKHLADSAAKDDGISHSFYALWNDDEFCIFDRDQNIASLEATQINDAVYSLSGNAKAKKKVGKVYIAASTGLSSYDAQTTVSGDVSAFSNLQLVTPDEFSSLKCLALSDEQIGIYLATDNAICTLDNGKIVELCSGFANVQNLDGFAARGLCALVFTDNGSPLKLYDVHANRLETFDQISAISKLAIVGDSSDDSTLADLSILWKSGDSLKTASITALTSGSFQPMVLSHDRDIDIFTDFRVNNHVTTSESLKTTLDARRHSKTYIQVHDLANNTYSISEYSPQLDMPTLLESSKLVTYANFIEMQLQPSQYAVSDSAVLTYGTASKTIQLDGCFDFQSIANDSHVSVFCRRGNDILSAGFSATATLNDIELAAEPMLHDISAYAIVDGNMSYVSSNCYFDSISSKDDFIKLISRDSSKKFDATRMFAIDQKQSNALGIEQGTIVIIGENGTAWTVQKDSTTLDQQHVPFSPVDELVQSGNGVYARHNESLSSAVRSTFLLEADLSSGSIVKTMPCKALGNMLFFYQDAEGWKYTFNGKTFVYVPQDIGVFGAYDIKHIMADENVALPNAVISAVTSAGIFTTTFIDQLKLSESGEAKTTSVQPYLAKFVYGKELGDSSNQFIAILSSDAGLSAFPYDAHSCTLGKTPTISYKGQAAFDMIAPVDQRLDSNMFYAISGDLAFLTDDAGSSDKLELYNDERLAGITIRSASHINGKNWFNTSDGTFISKENGESMQFQYQSNASTCFSSGIQQNALTSLLAGNDGIYTLVNRENALSNSIYKNTLCIDNTTALAQWDFTGTSPKYAYAISNEILTSDNCKQFNHCATLPEDVSVVYKILPTNAHDFFFGTDAGAYMARYAYVLSNDLKKFTALDAKHAYEDIEGGLSAAIDNAMSVHEADEHAESSLITYLNNNFLPTDMSGLKLSSWGHPTYNNTSYEMQANDDLVDTIEFGDDSDGDVTVTLSNFLTSDSNARCTYIIKRYMSGLVGIYVYIPTTNTYYINHVNGLPGCTQSQKAIDRQNLAKFKVKPFVADLTKHCSMFEVGIAATTLSIETLLGVEACGNSLPLKCYRDKNTPDADPNFSLMWHSYVEPTEIIASSASMQPNENGEYKFKFACFGSDAQAVKIMAFDPIHNANAVHFTVRFNANGAQGRMAAQRFIAGVAYKLRSCNFKWPDSENMSFAGWTDTPNPTKHSEVKFADKQLFMKNKTEVEDGQVIDLYAIWIPYRWSDNDNKFEIADTGDEIFFNYAEVMNSKDLENTALVDYGK